jgi:hypothetical protein
VKGRKFEKVSAALSSPTFFDQSFVADHCGSVKANRKQTVSQSPGNQPAELLKAKS